MKTSFILLAVVLSIGVISFLGIRRTASARPGSLNETQPVRPVIVELFTSEGCSSCPPADALLAKLGEQQRLGNAEVIALEEHVDYWDQLGWRDPFSSPQWTRRQQDYARAFKNEGIYTPQMVVDGRTEFVGGSPGKARSAIAEASLLAKADVILSVVSASTERAHVKVDIKKLPDPEPKEAQIWLAVTESGLHSDVKRGENAGEDLHHAAVVRSLRRIADAKPGEATAYSGELDVALDAAWQRQNIRLVVFVQDPESRHILGAAFLHLAQ